MTHRASADLRTPKNVACLVQPRQKILPDRNWRPAWRLTALADVDSAALDLDDAGSVIGWSVRPDCEGHDAVRFPQGRNSHVIASLGGTRSVALAIGEAGRTVGWSETRSGNTRAFVAAADEALALPAPIGVSSVAAAVNADAVVAGWVVHPRTLLTQAVVWRRGLMVRLGSLGGRWSRAHDINERGIVVGEAELADGRVRAFVARDGSMFDLGTLGGECSAALAVDACGTVVGHAQRSDGSEHACLWRDGIARDLGRLGGTFSHAYGLNGAGWVVGRSGADGTDDTRAFAWIEDRMVDLGSNVDARGWVLLEAWAVNSHGQIVGGGLLDGRPRAYRLDPVS